MQAVAAAAAATSRVCLCLRDLTSVNEQRGWLGVEVAPCVLPACESRKNILPTAVRGCLLSQFVRLVDGEEEIVRLCACSST